jgi:hypothetical protein
MSYKIYPLDVGDMELDSSFLSWQTDCGKKVSATTTAWLVTGADKPILIDTSFRSVEDAGKYQGLTCQRSEKQTLEAQLASFEIGLEDVGYIIHTHVHMDHAGQDYLFPNAKIILQRGELQHAAAAQRLPGPFLRPARCFTIDQRALVTTGVHRRWKQRTVPRHSLRVHSRTHSISSNGSDRYGRRRVCCGWLRVLINDCFIPAKCSMKRILLLNLFAGLLPILSGSANACIR